MKGRLIIMTSFQKGKRDNRMTKYLRKSRTKCCKLAWRKLLWIPFLDDIRQKKKRMLTVTKMKMQINIFLGVSSVTGIRRKSERSPLYFHSQNIGIFQCRWLSVDPREGLLSVELKKSTSFSLSNQYLYYHTFVFSFFFQNNLFLDKKIMKLIHFFSIALHLILLFQSYLPYSFFSLYLNEASTWLTSKCHLPM